VSKTYNQQLRVEMDESTKKMFLLLHPKLQEAYR